MSQVGVILDHDVADVEMISAVSKKAMDQAGLSFIVHHPAIEVKSRKISRTDTP